MSDRAEDSVVLTREILEAGRSRNGGWSDKQLKLLGVPYPLRQGWKRRLSGTRVPKADVQAFFSLKDDHLPQHEPERDEPNDNDLVAFLYLLLRDHLASGAVEKIMEDITEHSGLEREYCNEFTRDHAIDLAERLLGMT